jgi:hypothetical protein
MTCVECGLVDDHHGNGDGVGSCDCPRCDCGECRYCADAFSSHGEACRDAWYDDEDDDHGSWLDANPGRPTVTATVQGGLL